MKKYVKLNLWVTKDHIKKIESYGINNKSEAVRRLIDKTSTHSTRTTTKEF